MKEIKLFILIIKQMSVLIIKPENTFKVVSTREELINDIKCSYLGTVNSYNVATCLPNNISSQFEIHINNDIYSIYPITPNMMIMSMVRVRGFRKENIYGNAIITGPDSSLLSRYDIEDFMRLITPDFNSVKSFIHLI